MNQQSINILLWVSPLIVGGIFTVFNTEDVNDTTERAESWTRRTRSNASKMNNSLNRILLIRYFIQLSFLVTGLPYDEGKG